LYHKTELFRDLWDSLRVTEKNEVKGQDIYCHSDSLAQVFAAK